MYTWFLLPDQSVVLMNKGHFQGVAQARHGLAGEEVRARSGKFQAVIAVMENQILGQHRPTPSPARNATNNHHVLIDLIGTRLPDRTTLKIHSGEKNRDGRGAPIGNATAS